VDGAMNAAGSPASPEPSNLGAAASAIYPSTTLFAASYSIKISRGSRVNEVTASRGTRERDGQGAADTRRSRQPLMSVAHEENAMTARLVVLRRQMDASCP
jgi:hypothetical protein